MEVINEFYVKARWHISSIILLILFKDYNEIPEKKESQKIT